MAKGKLGKSWVVCLLIGAVMWGLVGCGGGSSQTRGESPEASPSAGREAVAPEAQAEANPLEGKTITFIVPFSTGGGFDTYARMIAPYLERYTGATVVVQNITGGGGLIGANTLYAAKPDGTTIGIMGGTNLIFSQTSGAEGVQFQAERFTYLGRVSADPNVCLVAAQKPYRTIGDLAEADNLKIAATGLDDDYFTWSVVAKAFGIENFEMVTGWEGNSQWLSALAVGDIDGGHTSAGSALPAIQNGYARAILQVAEERDERLSDVPTALELLPENDPNRRLIETLTNAWVADRVITAPPGMDESLVKALREAVEKTLNDPELTAKAEQAERPILYRSGEDLQRAIEDAMQSVGLLQPVFEEAAARIR